MSRNPRRSYASDGTEFPPMTLGNMRDLGPRSVVASCLTCLHSAIVNVDRFPDAFPVPDLALRMWCSKCRSRDIQTRPNWKEGKTGIRESPQT